MAKKKVYNRTRFIKKLKKKDIENKILSFKMKNGSR